MPPYDLASVAYTGDFVSSGISQNRGLTLKPDGTRVFHVEAIASAVWKRTLSTPWEVSSAGSIIFRVEFGSATNVRDIAFKPDGSILFATSSQVGAAWLIGLAVTSAWVESAGGPNFTVTPRFDMATELLAPTGFAFSPDGLHVFVLGSDAPGFVTWRVFRYDLATAWDVTTMSFVHSSADLVGNAPIAGQIGGFGLDFAPDGSRFWIDSSTNDRIYEYDLSTPWDVTTAVYNGVSLDVSTEDTAITGFEWGDDGYKLYVTGDANNRLYEYEAARPASGGWGLGLRIGP